MKALRDYREIVIEDLRKNPKDAQLYLEVALEEYEADGDAKALLLALRTVAEVKGGIGSLSKKTNLTRQSLYKALSPKGNPRLGTVGTILKGLGYRLSLKPMQSIHA